MAKTVIGVFSNREHAEMAINQLKETGYNPKDVSIIMKDTREGEGIAADTGASMGAGAVSGAATGAVLGGIAGLVATFFIPGLGAFFIGGPIATALGLTGTAGAVASGAATGALAGGLLGVLTGFGLSMEEAETYQEFVNKGGILVAVPARSGEEDEAEQILKDHEAYEVKTIEAKEVSPTMSEQEEIPTRRSRREEEEAYYRLHPIAGVKGGKARRAKSNNGKGRGWHGDREEHAMAGRGEDVPGRGEDDS